MSPALKSKTKNKSSASASKDSKVYTKSSSASVNGGNVSKNAYNPISGLVHGLEIESAASTITQNGRSLLVDELDIGFRSFSTYGVEYDSTSNNDSCSGESEDPKDKLLTAPISASRLEAVPGCDNDKREKNRQKNEKKHQRQKEKRAQDLHDRCTGFLMSRKLDSLTEKLVGMGFLVEHATRALMLNDGRAEDSVSWLLEGGVEKEPDPSKADGRANLKIDISDELTKIAELEILCKCSKQDVERAVVSCEGDLDRAAEALKSLKQEQAGASKVVKPSDTSPTNGTTKVATVSQNPTVRMSGKPSGTVSVQQVKRDDRDLNYPKNGATLPDLRTRMLQSSIKMQSKTDWLKNTSSQNDRRLPSMAAGPSGSYPLASSLQVATPSKVETTLPVDDNEGRSKFQMGTLKEPVIVMQRPQSINMTHDMPSSSGAVRVSQQLSVGYDSSFTASFDMGRTVEGGSFICPPRDSPWSSGHNFFPGPFVVSKEQTCWVTWDHGRSSGSTSSPTMPSSLGLFKGWNSVRSPRSSTVDWSMIGTTMPDFDYTSIDWSMDLSSSTVDSSSFARPYRSGDLCFSALPGAAPNTTHGGMSQELVEGSSMLSLDPSPYVGSTEWTSPFTGKDIFMLPRQFVASPL